ncbi:MAG: hypothetical protein ACYCYO_03760 [Bacilli bacterium]
MVKSDLLMWEMASHDAIDLEKIYVDLVNDLIAGLLLGRIVYWHLPNNQGKSKLRAEKDGLLWLVKSREDWWKETRITPEQYDHASKILDNLGIVTTKLDQFNGVPIVHSHMNWDAFFVRMDALREQLAASNALEKSGLDQEEQNAAIEQAVSGGDVLAFVPQAQAQAAVTAEVTPAPDPILPERTTEEEAFVSGIAACYIDNKFCPSANLYVQDLLGELIEEYGDTWVMGALLEALQHNRRFLWYVKMALEAWREEGCAPWEKPRPAQEA